MTATEEFLSRKPEAELYHYTSAAGLIGILKSRSIWASSHLHLNDDQEYKTASGLFQDELERSSLTNDKRGLFLELIRLAQRSNFVVSFSEKGDLLSQWRGYCPNGLGYSLGFKAANPLFRASHQKSFSLVQCEYSEAKQREVCKDLVARYVSDYVAPSRYFLERSAGLRAQDVPNEVRKFNAYYTWRLQLELVSSSFKHEGFHEEREWRLVSQYPEDLTANLNYRDGRTGIVPYFELPLALSGEHAKVDDLVIGPGGLQTAARESAEMMLKTLNFRDAAVRLSATPLRHLIKPTTELY